MATVAGDEDPAGVVDPDLLDRRVLQEGLQRPEARDPRDQLADHRLHVGHRGDPTGQAALVVVAHHARRDPAHQRRVALGVDAVAAHQHAHLLVEVLDQLLMRGRVSGPAYRRLS